MCLTSADIDPGAPISSPMGGARGLLRNPPPAMDPIRPWWVYGLVGAALCREAAFHYHPGLLIPRVFAFLCRFAMAVLQNRVWEEQLGVSPPT